jgi:hypothetical protein
VRRVQTCERSPKRVARLRSHDPIDGEAGALLELAHGSERLLSHLPVDRTGRKTELQQSLLLSENGRHVDDVLSADRFDERPKDGALT